MAVTGQRWARVADVALDAYPLALGVVGAALFVAGAFALPLTIVGLGLMTVAVAAANV